MANDSVEAKVLDDLPDDFRRVGDCDLLLVCRLRRVDEVAAALEEGRNEPLEPPKLRELPRLDEERQQVPPLVQRLVDLVEADVHVARRDLRALDQVEVCLRRVVRGEDPALPRLEGTALQPSKNK